MRKLIDAMAKHVEVIGPETTLAQAASRMNELNIGALPVSEHDEVVGMITDRDIVTRVVAEARDPRRTRAREVMTRDVIFCFEDEGLHAALEKMREKRVGRLIVLNRARRLKGLVTLGDLARQLGKEHMAALVAERLVESRTFGSIFQRRRRALVRVGAIAGVATLFAGLRLARERRIEGRRVGESERAA